MAKENRIGEISGYVNKNRLHDLGAIIVYSQDALERNWKTYKENGGKAEDIDKLK